MDYCRLLVMAQLTSYSKTNSEVEKLQKLKGNSGIFQHESYSYTCGPSDYGSK